MAAKFVMRSAEDVLSGIPIIFGFHPAESLIVLGLKGERQMHARIDLPDSDEGRVEAARVLTDALVRNAITSVLLVSYSTDRERVEAMGTEMEVSLLVCGIRALDHLWVSEGRYRAAGPNGFEPADGTAFDTQSHALMAEQVFAGRQTPAESRQALVESLHGEPDPAEALRAAILTLTADPSADAAAREALWLRSRVRQYLADRAPLDVVDAARFMAGMMVIRLRDVVWAEVTRENAAAMVDLLRDLLRRSQRAASAPVAALLGFTAWQAGHGALAWVAVDRCREVDPQYTLAGLVAAALEGAVPPSEWPGVDPGDLPVLGGDAIG